MSEKMAYLVELTLEGEVADHERMAINMVVQAELHRLLHARVQAFDSAGELMVKPIIEVSTLRVDTLQ